MIRTGSTNFSTQKAFFATIQVFLLVGISISLFATMYDGDLEATKRLEELMAKPREKRSLTPAEVEKYVGLAQDTKNTTSQVLAVLLLGCESSPASQQLLVDVVRETDKYLVLKSPSFRQYLSGAAQWSLVVRKTILLDKAQALALLSFHLGNSDNPYARLFIANRLYVDFGQESLEILLAASRVEQVDFVKAQYLYYLARAESPVVRQQAREVEWPSKEFFPQVDSFLMGVLTPGRSKDAFMETTSESLKKLGDAKPAGN